MHSHRLSPSAAGFGPGLLAAALLAALCPAGAQFGSAKTVVAATQPESVAVGDWDGDTDADLAITVDEPDGVLFLYNDGHENFGSPSSVPTGDSTSPHGVVAADLDGDGDEDVAVTLQATNEVRVLLNNGLGGFSLGSATTTGTEPRSLRVGDFNGGAPDLVSSNRAGDTITVLLNTGSATFTATTLAAGLEPRGLDVGDLNGDGDVDIAVAVHDSRRVQLFANGGGGDFSAAGAVLLGATLQPEGVAIANVDGDGDRDIGVTASGNGLHVVALSTNSGPGSGAGQFTAPVLLPVNGLDPSHIEAADFNLDGAQDLATLNEGSANVSVLLGNGNATFLAPALFSVLGVGSQSLTAADVDGNGGTDLAVANSGSNTVSLLFNLNGLSVFVAVPNSGLEGVAGIPTLVGDSTLQGGTTVELSLTGAAPLNAVAVVVGLTPAHTPFKGGVLVPDDDLFLVFGTSITGTLQLAGTLPNTVPSGISLYIQTIVADSFAVFGFALSNAIAGVTP